MEKPLCLCTFENGKIPKIFHDKKDEAKKMGKKMSMSIFLDLDI